MNMPDYVSLEMRMAELMAQQEASGFRFDMDAAERVREKLACEAESLQKKIAAIYRYYPGKVFTPKRTTKSNGYVAGAPMTKLVEFNPDFKFCGAGRPPACATACAGLPGSRSLTPARTS